MGGAYVVLQQLQAYNVEEELDLKLFDGSKLKKVNDFKYVGS